MLDDLRHAYRRLRSRPALMLAAAAMLALGIGLTTAMFTVVDALILRPVPFTDAGRLTRVAMFDKHGGRGTVARAVLEAWRGSPAFDAAEGLTTGKSIVEAGAGPVVRASARVSPGMFAMLGTRPIRGRVFDATEGRAGSDDRVLLSEDVWRSSFGADPDLVGRRITVDGASLVVVGVMPREFRFPEWNTVVWKPLDFSSPPAALASELPQPVVRLSSGIPRSDALRIATDAARAADATLTSEMQATPLPLAGVTPGFYDQRAIPLLAGGVGLVFLVLCANVCSLLLARLTARQREFRMCAALGASRARLLRQAAIEHGLLGVIGAGLGVGLAWALVSLSRAFLPEAFLLRTLNPVDLDARALIVAASAGFVATMAAGLLPAWIGTRPDAGSALGRAERTSTETRAARALTRVLLVAEVAFACTLLVGAALLVRSFLNLASVDRGLRTDNIMTAWIGLPSKVYPAGPARVTITAALETAVRSLPGVEQVALSSGLPPGGGGTHYFDDWRGDGPDAKPQTMEVQSYNVGPDFFALYGIPLLQGRTFEPGDGPDRAIVGERLAKRLWPGGSPVGRSFSYGKTSLQVVGLAREINLPSLETDRDHPEFYRPFVFGASSIIYMNVSCHGRCPDEAVVRKQILATVPPAAIYQLGMLSEAYREELARPRATAALGSTFAVIAVLAAAGGLFSVLSYAVGRRRREFGIRAALGASPKQIRGLVYRDGVQVAAMGVALGIAASIALGRAIASLQYGVSGFDPVSWLMVLGILTGTTLLASWRPARTAVRVDPISLLRED
jgi:putative ABC transport system permease protein